MEIIPITTNIPKETAEHGWKVIWSSELGTSRDQAVIDAQACSLLAQRGVPHDGQVFRTSGGDFWHRIQEAQV